MSYRLSSSILLYTLCSFTAYVLVLVFTVIAQNLAAAVLADRMYPYLKDKNVEKIEKKEIKEISGCTTLGITLRQKERRNFIEKKFLYTMS